MPKFLIHHTEDLITIESKSQAIAIIGFSLSKLENISQGHLSGRVFNLLDSFDYSYVVQLTKNHVRFFLLLSAQNAGKVIDKVSILLDKIDKLRPVDSLLVLSPLNHSNIASSLQKIEYAPIKKTSNSKIVQIDDRFWVFASLVLSRNNVKYFTKYVKGLLTYKQNVLSLSTRVLKGKKKKNKLKTIVFSNNFSTFVECEEFLNHLRRISLQYMQKLSFTLKFHAYAEIKRRRSLLFLGLSDETQTLFLWRDIIRIDKFIPNLELYNNTIIQQEHTEKEKESTISQPENLAAVQAIQIEQPKTGSEPIFPYGKTISEDEIKELIKKIPSPNT